MRHVSLIFFDYLVSYDKIVNLISNVVSNGAIDGN